MTTYVDAKAEAKVKTLTAATQSKIAAADAETERRIRREQAAVEIARQRMSAASQRLEAERSRKSRQRAERAERRTARREARQATRAAVTVRCVAYVQHNAPAVYSGVIYGMAVTVAVSGQIDVATSRHWSPLIGVGMAVFIEGLALSMALTAHAQRLKGERALAARALTWLAACFAAGINVAAHAGDAVMAAVLGASSVAAIVVWEVRSGAKHRDALRKLGLIPEPPERFGWRRWARYPIETYRAWSLDIRSRVGGNAARLIGEVQTGKQHKREVRQSRRDQRHADKAARREQRRQARDERQLDKQARKADKNIAKSNGKPQAPQTVTGDVPVTEAAPAEAPVPVAPKRRTGTRKPKSRKTRTAVATDAELTARLKSVPREDDGTVPVRRAARALACGVDRARRLLVTQGLLRTDPTTAATEVQEG